MATGERLQGKVAIVTGAGTRGPMPGTGQATSILFTEGSAWDVAWAAVLLTSDESRWVSDVVLPIDAKLLAATPLAVWNNLR